MRFCFKLVFLGCIQGMTSMQMSGSHEGENAALWGKLLNSLLEVVLPQMLLSACPLEPCICSSMSLIYHI